MQFTEHQSRLWGGMIEFIENFRKGQSCYSDLIYGLEGALDSGDYQNKELIKRWYEYWTPLEILYATKGDSVTIEDAMNYLYDMESFLRSILVED